MTNKTEVYPENPELQAKYAKEVESIERFSSSTNQMKMRVPLLIPFNVVFFYGSIKFMQNYRYLMNRYWPFKRRSTLKNLLFNGTIQGMMIAGFYVSCTFGILGFNPMTVRKLYGSMNDSHSVANQVFLLAMFENMGLKEETIKMIQRDLAEQAEKKEREEK